MSKQVITLSDRAAERVKEIMAKAKEPIVGVRVGVAVGVGVGVATSSSVVVTATV